MSWKVCKILPLSYVISFHFSVIFYTLFLRRERWGDLKCVNKKINEWIKSGVIRRIGAVLAHRRVGFSANGMACFSIPQDRIDDIGRQLARSPDISHCYNRPALPDFPYNLFAMVHGQSEEQVRTIVSDMAREVNQKDYEVLLSTVEHKKTSMKYFA